MLNSINFEKIGKRNKDKKKGESIFSKIKIWNKKPNRDTRDKKKKY